MKGPVGDGRTGFQSEDCEDLTFEQQLDHESERFRDKYGNSRLLFANGHTTLHRTV